MGDYIPDMSEPDILKKIQKYKEYKILLDDVSEKLSKFSNDNDLGFDRLYNVGRKETADNCLRDLRLKLAELRGE